MERSVLLPEKKKDFCRECPLYEQVGVFDDGTDPTVMFIGMAPARNEVRTGFPFVGRSGTLLRNAIRSAFGVEDEREVCCITNLCMCFVAAGESLPKEAVSMCYENVLKPKILHSKPKVIVALGNDVFRQLMGVDIPMGDICGIPHVSKEFNCWVIPTYHPSAIVRQGNDKGMIRQFLNSIRTAKLLKDKPLPEFPKVHELMLTKAEDIIKFLDNLIELAELIVFDFETTTQRPYSGGYIRTIAICDGEVSVAFPFQNYFDKRTEYDIYSRLMKLWSSKKLKIVHNLMFESEWVWHVWRYPLKTPLWDTMVINHALYSGSLSAQGLKYLVTKRLGFPEWGIDVTNVEKIELEELLKYNCLDAKYTYYLYLTQKRTVDAINEGKQVIPFYGEIPIKQRKRYLRFCDRLLLPAITFVAKAQYDGVPINFEFIEQKKTEFLTEVEKLLTKIYTDEKLLEFSPETKAVVEFLDSYGVNIGKVMGIVLDYIDERLDIKFPKDFYTSKGRLKIKELIFNINSTKQLGDFLKWLGYDVPKTEKGNYQLNEDTIEQFADVNIVKWYIQLKKIQKMLKTYIVGTLKVAYPDGKLHTNYIPIGNNSSRFMSRAPNVQNYPKRKFKEMRNIFRAPDGYIMISADFSALEIRGEAMVSGDEELTKFIVEGKDAHLFWSERLYGKRKAEEMRNTAKNKFVFPMLYGAGVKTLSEGTGINEEKIKKFRDEFWKIHSGIKRRHELALRDYRNFGEIYDAMGRVRKAPLNYQMIMNYAIQSSCFYLTLLAWYTLLRKGYWVPLCIHDELVLIVENNEQSISRAVNDIYDAMVNEPKRKYAFVAKSPVPIEIDMKIGEVFGSLEEFDWKKYLRGGK